MGTHDSRPAISTNEEARAAGWVNYSTGFLRGNPRHRVHQDHVHYIRQLELVLGKPEMNLEGWTIGKAGQYAKTLRRRLAARQ